MSEAQTVRRVCLLSPHGHVSAAPWLGQTDTGGQVVVITQLARALAAQGVAVDVFTRRFDERPEIEELSPGARIVRLPAGPPDFVRKEDIGPWLSMFTRRLHEHLGRERPAYQLLHSHYWDGGVVGAHLAHHLGLPLVHTAHSIGGWKRERQTDAGGDLDQLFRFKERIAAEHAVFAAATRLTAASGTEVELLRRHYGVGSERVDVVPPGVDPAVYHPAREERQPYLRPFVFTTGRHALSKGLDLLVAAFAASTAAQGAMLVIGGGSQDPTGEERQVRAGIEAAVARHGLAGRVHIVGHLEPAALLAHYRHAALFALTSTYEPFGLAVLEAMACGAPAVVSARGGIREILRHGENALLVEPTDLPAVAAAFDKLLGDPHYARLLGTAGSLLVHEQFTWRHVAGLLRASYDRALGDTTAAAPRPPREHKE